MSFLFDVGLYSIAGPSGAALSGATLKWYQSGTTTPATTYVDPGLATPNPSTITIGSDGRLPPIWLNEQNYKLVVTLPGGSIITSDPIRNPAVKLVENLTATVPAQVKSAIETDSFSIADMANPETLAAIINRTGITPQMKGAAPTDSNHSPVINDCIDTLISAGGGTLWLPPMPGEWKVGSSIICHKAGHQSSNIKIKGTGDNVVMRWLNQGGDMFVIGDGVNHVYNVNISDLYLKAGVVRKSGCDFLAKRANMVKISNVVSGGSWNGFFGEDLNSVYLDTVQFISSEFEPSTGNGVTIYSDPMGSGRTDVVRLTEVTVQGHSKGVNGLLIEGRVYGVDVDGAGMLGVKRGLNIHSSSPVLGDIPAFSRFRRFEVDRATDTACVIDTAYQTEFLIPDLMNTSAVYGTAASDNEAVLVNAGAYNTIFHGGRMGGCRKQALSILGKNTKVLGTTMTDLARHEGAGYAGIYVGPSADGFNIQDATVEGFGRATYAIAIDAAARNGTVRDMLYKNVKNGYAFGTGVNVDNTGQKLVTYAGP